MSFSTERSPEEGAVPNAQEWAALAEYERLEAVFHLLKRISGTCLRHGHLRVMEREELMCFGAHAEPISTTRRLLLYGRVPYCHREALLAFVRQVRLHSVRDLDTAVTVGLQAGDLVPHLLLEPLTPSLHTNAYALWHRVYCAMRCGIFRHMEVRQQKMKHRLRQLIRESAVTSSTSEAANRKEAGTRVDTVAASPDKLSTSGRANTLRFYAHEFAHLVGKNAGAPKDQGGADGSREPLALEDFVATAKETRVSLACIAATVPSVFVVWSCRYPECVDWLRRHLFNDSHLQEVLDKTGLSGRYAVLLDKDPWLSFAAEQGEVLPRLPAKETFRIELLKPLPKRAQIVLLNVDEDVAEARTAYEHLKGGLHGWQSPEVDLLSLWCGHQGLQSEVATLFRIETLPFIVGARPGGRSRSSKASSRAKLFMNNSRRPVIVRSSRDTLEVAKDMYGIADTPKMRRRRGERGAPTLALSENDNTWHNLTASERAHIVDRLSKHIVQRRLPLCFTACVGREYVIRNPYTSDPWKAVECVASSYVRLDGEYVTGQDLMPVATELRHMHQLDGFQFNVSIIEPSAPLVSSLNLVTPQMRVEGKTHVATCAHCELAMNVDVSAHLRCLHCASSDKSAILCEVCAFTALHHPPHHILLRIPAGVWAPSLPLLWGPSNVAPLAVLAERFKPNPSRYHYGIYCNRCRSMIRGTRWKCARCYQYDLCDTCARIYSKRAASTKSKSDIIARGDAPLPVMPSSSPSPLRPTPHVAPLCSEDATHPMLFIPNMQGCSANSFLKPPCTANLGEWLRTL
ncbi:hypothetical protein, conserved [Leishmania donovani]|uniref:Zinc finger, ZZ type family protein n=1 Tax=Leishmania donovani TaxID=5661 RepID=E9BEH9_LEIDO|nr:hypothetical protein, conserved [Leishmania donovani]TPP49962.1 Zinc finger, ZZ type family protein [Leishmania donovani]CBZ33665.1 hypothetical protein, conserved [Leishmania donovani]